MSENPVASLHLHCKYRSGQELCPVCRKQLFLKAGIIKDFYVHGKGQIMRILYFYSPMYDQIRMKWLDPPITLIGDESWNLIALADVGIYDIHSKVADKYAEPGDFQDAAEELYTFEQFTNDAKALAALRAKKRKALF